MKRSQFSKITVMLTSSLLTIALLTPFQAQAEIQEAAKTAALTELDNKRDDLKEKHHSIHHHQKNMSKEQLQELKLKRLQKLAVYFDISIEGKTVDQLRSEIEVAKKKNPEKWEVFKQQFRAKKLERLRQFAKEKGITIDGKSEEQLRKELKKLNESEKQ